MSELGLQPNPNPGFDNLDQEVLDEINSAEVIDEIAQRGIHIENPDHVAGSLDSICGEFEISKDAFSNFKTTLTLVAAAQRLSNAKDSENPDFEKKYIKGVVLASAGKYTKFRDQATEYIDPPSKESNISDEKMKETYESYAQPELTADMTRFLQGPHFDELRTRLGVEEDEVFQVRVLSIDTGDTHGLIPDSGTGPDSDMTLEELNSLGAEQDVRRQYINELENRTARFAQEFDRDSIFAPAWLITFDDRSRFLCVSSALAEKVMYPDEERASYYSQRDRERDLATLMHEYTHTQGMIVSGKIEPGIALEELRAEHFSGNKQGYADIKRLFFGVSVLTGHDITDYFEIDGQSYDEEMFLEQVAINLGLDGFLDAMMAIPSNYADDEEASQFIQDAVEHDGGLSKIFEKFLARALESHGPNFIEERISKMVDNLRNRFKGLDYISVESWLAYGGIDAFRDMGIKNFRDRYPDESDGHDYNK